MQGMRKQRAMGTPYILMIDFASFTFIIFFLTLCLLNHLDNYNQRIIHCCQALIAENVQQWKSLFYYADSPKSPSKDEFRAAQNKD